ncbi:helix-turn-helix transcriptional regulator [Sphingomonas sp. So64.6b]|uniref:helix-turn-helix domain-containing protein n=1 Tax=Sphingomonas sp. So64.6b TaxID=2997354 RepID=UPI001602344D|nr:AraC family transcriptional regulator [Sphingomonas sp. So64.6b]QNA83576.1 helix-turn-helix transcriptional regulator [Sphingomonas sp. So64.6b]
MLARHSHAGAFAAIVLAGGYVEAGDTGRHRVVAGDVLFHHAYEAHLNRVPRTGAEVFVLPLRMPRAMAIHGRIADPDTIVRLAERDLAQATGALLDQVQSRATVIEDWPDMLAQAILADPNMSIGAWASDHGLHPGSVSRGFRQEFEISPASFRVSVRAQRAILALGEDKALAQVALTAGFADQAHMSRVLKKATGQTPKRVREQHAQVGGSADPRAKILSELS